MKIGIVLVLISIGFVLLGIFGHHPDYHYRGVAEVPIETALQLQLESGSERVSVTTYSSESDTVYITYNFWKCEEGLYGLDSEREVFTGRILPTVLLYCFALAVVAILGLWAN